MILKLSSAPGAEPLSAAEAKAHLRVDHSDDDTYISTLIKAARHYIEQVTNRALITQTWIAYLDDFLPVIQLPKPELISVTGITYVDTDGTTQNLGTSIYTVDTDSLPGRVYEAYNQSWPTVRDIPKAVAITYTAGYGAASTNVPEPILQASKILVAHWYENREPVIVGTIASPVPLSVTHLLAPYKVHQF